MVVNRKAGENGLVPPAFFALTRQKCKVLFASGPMATDDAPTVESSNTVLANDCSTDICARYVVAPVTATQLNDELAGTFVAPSGGVLRVGARGAATIVLKLKA